MAEDLCVELVPLFQTLDYQDQMTVAKLVHKVTVTKGSLVLAPGDDQQLVILARGQLRVVQYTEQGDEHLQSLMQAGDYLGESWLFGAENESLTVIASQDSVVCTIQAHEFHQLLGQLPELSYQLLQATILRNNDLTKRVELLAIGRIYERVKAYFADLALQQGSNTIHLPFELKDVASYLGTTPETISRQLTKLKARGEIRKLTPLVYQLGFD